jgi:putative oxidoreductase
MQLENTWSAWSPRLLSVLRIMVALLFMEHGTSKLFGFPPFAMGEIQLFSLIGLSAILESLGGLLLLIGLFTRPVAFILSGEMAFAYFMAHAPKSFFPANNGGDAAILFCFLFLYLSVAGPGAWSLDTVRTPAHSRNGMRAGTFAR